MKSHSVIFIGGDESPGTKYERLDGKEKNDFCRIIDNFRVSPVELPRRIVSSFVPPIFGGPLKRVYVDFAGPAIALILLWGLLEIGHSDKHPSATVATPPIIALSYYCLVMPPVCILLAKMGNSDLAFIEVIALLGYGLYGHVFTIFLCFIFNLQTSNFFFFTFALIFSGPSCLRLIVVFLLTIPKPITRLLICSVVAVFHVLFLIFVHFAYMHRTFVYGASTIDAF